MPHGAVLALMLAWPAAAQSDSLPLGNGDIGVNVWAEPSGDIVFYISKTDAWNENVRLLKLGRIRLRLTPSPLEEPLPAGLPQVSQKLALSDGVVDVGIGNAGAAVWVDANRPVVRVEIRTRKPCHLEAQLEVWRDRERVLEGREAVSAYGLHGGPDPIVESPDTVVEGETSRIVWYHRNERSIWAQVLRHQGLESLIPKLADPLLGRMFGAAAYAPGMAAESPGRLRSAKPQRRFVFSVYPLTMQTATVEEWKLALDRQIAAANNAPVTQTRDGHLHWWQRFWARSFIEIAGQQRVTEGYRMQRYLNACAGRGSFPIKFNGSIFTVDSREPDEHFDADYRRWGGPYWFQNTRLPYWAMLAAGDFDQMTPLFRMYEEMLPLTLERTRLYFEHGGAFFPETMYFFGAYANTNYGFKRAGLPLSHVETPYIRYYYDGAIELLAMLLDYYAYTGKKPPMALADAILDFYDFHYPSRRIEPAQALETWWDVVNPLPVVAGLRWVLPRVIPLAAGERRARYQKWLSELPPIPLREGRLAAAEVIRGEPRNSENPELYAVFPYRFYGVGKPDLEMARRTFETRRIQESRGWRQDAIQAAYLGLADQAREYVEHNFSTPHKGSGWPGFYGPNFDWVPDQDQPSVAMIALQRMLVQAEGDKVQWLPAWPKQWESARFRVFLPGKRIAEGEIAKGKIARLRVQ